MLKWYKPFSEKGHLQSIIIKDIHLNIYKISILCLEILIYSDRIMWKLCTIVDIQVIEA